MEHNIATYPMKRIKEYMEEELGLSPLGEIKFEECTDGESVGNLISVGDKIGCLEVWWVDYASFLEKKLSALEEEYLRTQFNNRPIEASDFPQYKNGDSVEFVLNGETHFGQIAGCYTSLRDTDEHKKGNYYCVKSMGGEVFVPEKDMISKSIIDAEPLTHKYYIGDKVAFKVDVDDSRKFVRKEGTIIKLPEETRPLYGIQLEFGAIYSVLETNIIELVKRR